MKVRPYPVKFSSISRPNSIEFSSLNSSKKNFSHSEKCGKIRYTGVKFTSVDELWTENKTDSSSLLP